MAHCETHWRIAAPSLPLSFHTHCPMPSSPVPLSPSLPKASKASSMSGPSMSGKKKTLVLISLLFLLSLLVFYDENAELSTTQANIAVVPSYDHLGEKTTEPTIPSVPNTPTEAANTPPSETPSEPQTPTIPPSGGPPPLPPSPPATTPSTTPPPPSSVVPPPAVPPPAVPPPAVPPPSVPSSGVPSFATEASFSSYSVIGPCRILSATSATSGATASGENGASNPSYVLKRSPDHVEGKCGGPDFINHFPVYCDWPGGELVAFELSTILSRAGLASIQVPHTIPAILESATVESILLSPTGSCAADKQFHKNNSPSHYSHSLLSAQLITPTPLTEAPGDDLHRAASYVLEHGAIHHRNQVRRRLSERNKTRTHKHARTSTHTQARTHKHAHTHPLIPSSPLCSHRVCGPILCPLLFTPCLWPAPTPLPHC